MRADLVDHGFPQIMHGHLGPYSINNACHYVPGVATNGDIIYRYDGVAL